ncbi:hypothetical protein HMPREF9086_2770 [Enterobacter hormaechei ATCC 49162]|nr:hypothetical protein HMPREF9086_2770 [Enterobacter hormaechei ATCC 49162]
MANIYPYSTITVSLNKECALSFLKCFIFIETFCLPSFEAES